METTRQTILNILRRRQATVDDLTTELGLAAATVRRHLDILTRDGHVDVAQVRRKTGRPHYLFSLSEAGEGLFPKQYVRTTRRLIDEIVALTPEETAGRNGAELADLVFEKMSQRVAQRVLPRVHGASLAERVRATAEALAAEGIAFDVEADGAGFLFAGNACPCARLAERESRLCGHDQRLLSLLLAADVSYGEASSNGRQAGSAYRVREGRPSGASLPGGGSAV